MRRKREQNRFWKKYDEQVRVLSIGEDISHWFVRGYSCQKNWRFGAFIIESIECFFWVRRIEAGKIRAFDTANLRSIVTSKNYAECSIR